MLFIGLMLVLRLGFREFSSVLETRLKVGVKIIVVDHVSCDIYVYLAFVAFKSHMHKTGTFPHVSR